ncbi:MAG: type II toxin-antitoxin system RelE/ParE family toxin [Candidatus Kuenenia sp.]|nr:type II toxin-antitoxin system RelE/ParE family toxin [Candidatus Kuenenia sp.]
MIMPYELHIERHAEKDLNKLEKSLFIQIATKIKELATNPHPRGSKKITDSQNDWRLRVGDYRVLYEIDKKTKTINIMRIKHRREAYRDLQ